MGGENSTLSGVLNHFPFFLHYRGNYKNNLTLRIVEFVEANLSLYFKKNVVGKLSYLVIEAIQNMERYTSDQTSGDDYCYIFSDHQYFHIITRNTIKNSDIDGLKSRLDHVNSKSEEELREIYTQVLAAGEGTTKGAGLGLIDIARKSKNPLVYSFKPLTNEISAYHLHIKISLLKDPEAGYEGISVEPLIQELTNQFSVNKNTLFYSGDFSNAFIQTLLSLVSNLKNTDDLRVSSVFKYALIELTQNMKRHGKSIENTIPGYLCIEWREKKALLRTFNFIATDDVDALTTKLDRLNSSSQEKLLEESEEHLTDFSLQGGLGLVDIARLNWPKPIMYTLENHATFGTGIQLTTEFDYE